MSAPDAAERRALVNLSFLADPADPVLGALLRTRTAAEMLTEIMLGDSAPPLITAADLGLPGTEELDATPGPGGGPGTEPGFGQPLRDTGGELGTGPGAGQPLRDASGPMWAVPDILAARPAPGDTDSGEPEWGTGRGSRAVPGAERALKRWRGRIGLLPTAGRLAAWERAGLRLICRGDPEWPTQLDDLGDGAPLVLWVQGTADLRFACLKSVSVVGSRAATGYGSHVSTELAATLAERGFAVISGGAYGVDSCAHRGALAAAGTTIAVLASGLAYGYPRGHHDLFAAIADQGAVVSECPPDRAPTRPGFLIRNRIIAALSRGTVVVEAALRSGALNTAKHARELRRPLMAIPGPVTSAESAGCHELIREWGALCVTGARDVLEHVSPIGTDLAGPRLGPAVPRDHLDPVTRSVLEAVPARGGRGPASVAVLAGVDLDTALRCLGLLAAAGFVQRCDQGWRARKNT